MALMRGVLGDAEVAAVVAVSPQGAVKVLAIMATNDAIAEETRLADDEQDVGPGDTRCAKIVTTMWRS